jgi:hypothetical protein
MSIHSSLVPLRVLDRPSHTALRLVVASIVFAIALAACQSGGGSGQAGQASSMQASASTMNPVEHGKHLVTTMGCNDCHTPFKMGPNGPEPDMSRMLSGHPQSLVMPPAPNLGNGPWTWVGSGTMTAFAGPWGVSFSANLTPDTTTGLGAWSEDMFIQTLRNGRHMGTGRQLLPPMPWNWAGQLTDDELKAVFAYLRTIPPIKNEVPQPVPPAGGPGAGMGAGQ